MQAGGKWDRIGVSVDGWVQASSLPSGDFARMICCGAEIVTQDSANRLP